MGSYVELLKACKEGNSRKVRKLLEDCTDIGDVRDLTDKTLLHYCFKNDSCSDLILEAAPELLDVGDKHGYTVLHLASMIKPPVSLKYILSKKPDINKRNNDSRSALILAVIYDNWEAVEILCEHNADVNVTDITGVSPLHYAAKTKSPKDSMEMKIIDILLENGSNIDSPDSYDRSPLMWAVCSNNITKMNHLIAKGSNIYSKDNSGLSILHYATSNGNVEILKLLLDEYNFNIETLDSNLCTALMYACSYNNQDIIEMLLEKGSNVNAEDCKRRNAAHFACGKGDLRNLKILYKYNADLWKLNNDSNYPLHEAAYKGHTDIVEFLIEEMKDKDLLQTYINHRNSNGQTPLHLATAKDNFKIAEILLENGADPNIPLRVNNGKSMTALDLANQDLTKQLIQQYNGKSADDVLKTSVIKEEQTASISEEYSEDSESESMSIDSDAEENDKHSSSEIEHFDINEKDEYSEKDGVSESKDNKSVSEDSESIIDNRNIENTASNSEEHRTESKGSDIQEHHKRPTIEITEEYTNSLLFSCKNGDVNEIQSFIENGGSLPDIIDKSGKTLLHYSIKNREAFEIIIKEAPELIHRSDNANISVLNMIIMSKENYLLPIVLNLNADYNFSDCNGRTSLHLAVIYENLESLNLMCNLITDKNLFCHKKDLEGCYPLHYAVEISKIKKTDCQCKDFLELLLQMNGDIECRDNINRTPLLLAVNIKNIEAVTTLLKYGANIMAKDNQNLCSIHYVCSLGSLEILNELAKFESFDPDVEDPNGLTPLFYAISSCDEKIVKRLIELNAKINVIDHCGRSLCHKAAEKGAFKCLEHLILCNVDPWLKAHDGTMPLHEAAYRGYKEIAEILLNTPAARENINVKNNNGQTALHLAAVRNDCPMCYLLIDKGSSINEILHHDNNAEDVTAYDLATTPYCKDTLREFGGKTAKKIIDYVNPETDFEILDELMMKQDNPIFGRNNSIRSTELALSTIPSIVYTAQTNERSSSQLSHSNKPVQSSKQSSKKSKNSSRKNISICESERSLLNSSGSDRKTTKPLSVGSEKRIINDSNSDLQSQHEKISSRKSGNRSAISECSGLSREQSKCTSADGNTRKSSSRSKSSKASKLSVRKNNCIEKEMQNRVHNSVLNYEYTRLSCKIANDIMRQKIREENDEKLKHSRGNRTVKTSRH